MARKPVARFSASGPAARQMIDDIVELPKVREQRDALCQSLELRSRDLHAACQHATPWETCVQWLCAEDRALLGKARGEGGGGRAGVVQPRVGVGEEGCE